MTIRGGNQQRNDPLRSGETWIWRQVGFLGKDKLVTGQRNYDLPPSGPLRDNGLLTWTHSPNPTPLQLPCTVTEWGLSWTTPFEQTWISGVTKSGVQKPFTQSDWPVPNQSYRLDQFWAGNNPGALRAPFNQKDWSLPPPQYRLDETFVYSYNLNLIGKDKLPHRQADWP